MISFQNEVEIGRQIDEVFGYVADLENVPEWNYAIDETRKVTPGPVGEGTRYRQVRSVPRPGEEALEIVDYVPPSDLVVEGDLGPFRARLGYRFESSGTGTLLTNEVELTPNGPTGFLARVASNRIAEAVAANLGQLKTRLEA